MRISLTSRVFVAVIALGVCSAGAIGQVVDARRGQLIVFVQPDASPLAEQFAGEHLPGIRKLADEMNVPLRVVDARKGAPEEITITPLIVYQNFRGRAIFQGRYTDLSRIKTFIRTSRAVPQGKKALRKEHVATRMLGRATIVAPLKIAAVTGTPPDDYHHEQFVEEARRSIYRELATFTSADKVEMGRADRMFYMDFYPWRAEDGTLYLSVALFSQFHCKKPVCTTEGKPLTGPWKERDRLYREAAALLEKAVEQQIATSPIGDGFDVVPASTRTVTWESLGLALPPPPRGKTPGAEGAPRLGRNWVVAKPDASAPPLIQFGFPAPLDMYAGEVKRVSGKLTLGNGLSLGSAQGYFEADPASVTMGEPDLDDALSGSLFLQVSKYPTSRFVIESVSAERARIAFGHTSTTTLTGTFELKGVGVPLSVRTTFEPVIDNGGNPRLLMQGAFSINLRDFKIEEADGPEPANHTLNFNIHFVLEPETP